MDEAKKEVEEAYDKEMEEAKVDEAKKEVEEMKAKVEELTKELHEVNLLNAKLLYTNKLFRAKNLTEAQKVKVLESFDKASNVKEAKLVFETLNEGIRTKQAMVNEVKGSASRATQVAKQETKQPIVESNQMISRFQKLAGII